ncbi:MAG: threonine--tRNA ligase [candidate division KSB1 bacterium]|nr:threonine--tRNA ligase [candidate division KSB1 bacterium]
MTIRLQFNSSPEQLREYDEGVRPIDVLADVGLEHQDRVVAARFNGSLVDLTRELHGDGRLEFVYVDEPDGLHVYWHSTAHVMAHAIKDLFPEAKFGIGPPIEQGFYYDVDVPRPFTPADLEAIEKRMAEIIAADHPFIRQVVTREEAIRIFRERGEPYKLELLEALEEEPSIYQEDGFIDLCAGPHLPSTGRIRFFKLLSTSGAYWRGDEKRPMLQRIYGISFPEKSQLDQFLLRLEEAKRRDHRRLGRELDLYSIDEEVGPGLVLWHPKGAIVRHIIESYWKERHLKAGYELVYTPHVARLQLWERSGHLDFFRENMFPPSEIEEVPYQIKPMNCPFHLRIYKSRTRSYRDLPIRWAELGTVYRYERSGVLHGLLRVRGFTQDDAHIFCRPDQLEDEVLGVLNFTLEMLSTFGFANYQIFLSTRPQRYVGTIENWELATAALRNALEKRGLEYSIDPGEGVFYGPKIDIKIRDVLDRPWQCSTIQVDFNEPERFDLSYMGQDGQLHRPIMIHRALLGSLERFLGVLIEHYAGAFPLWLAPVQVVVIPITDAQLEGARKVTSVCKERGLRVWLDDRPERINYKIRDAETQKIPYMLIIGKKEDQEGLVSVRQRGRGDIGSMKFEAFLERVQREIDERRAA